MRNVRNSFFILMLVAVTVAGSIDNWRTARSEVWRPETHPTSATQQGQSVVAERFVFEVKECKKLGDRITCELLITNNDRDRPLSIRDRKDYGKLGGTRTIDDLGNVYNDAKGQLGVYSLGRSETLLVAGIPIKATIFFDGVASDASKISLLEVDCYTEEGGKENFFSVQIRNVPLRILTPAAGAVTQDGRKASVVVTKEFSFVGNSCKVSVGTVVCLFAITNEASAARALSLDIGCRDNKPRMLDQVGNEYLSTEGNFGKKTFVKGRYGDCHLSENLDAGAEVSGSVKFENVDNRADTARLLRLTFGLTERNALPATFYVDFRDIPLIPEPSITRGDFRVNAFSPEGTPFSNPYGRSVEIRFVASGQWSFWPEQGFHSADGNLRYAIASRSGKGYKLPSAPLGGLIVQRRNGQFELVGTKRVIRLEPNERLLFVMNDSKIYASSYDDNRGAIKVEWSCVDCNR